MENESDVIRFRIRRIGRVEIYEINNNSIHFISYADDERRGNSVTVSTK